MGTTTRRTTAGPARSGPRRLGALMVLGVLALAAAVVPTAAGAATDTRRPTRQVDHVLGTADVPAKPKRIVVASVSATGNLLAIGAPVVASGTSAPSKLTDEHGFFTQWADVAVDRDVVPLGGPVPSVESIAAQRPDVIIGTANGADAVTDVYDQLSQIAPTIVVDASGSSWQDVATELGRALGLKKNAKKAIARFDELAEETADSISVPTEDAVAMVYSPQGGNVFTRESPHGQLLEQLGFTVVQPEGSSNFEGGNRSDVVPVSLELLPDLIGDATVFLVFADDATVATAKAVPVLAGTPAFADERAYALGVDSFRIDYYSATAVAERVGDLLG